MWKTGDFHKYFSIVFSADHTWKACSATQTVPWSSPALSLGMCWSWHVMSPGTAIRNGFQLLHSSYMMLVASYCVMCGDGDTRGRWQRWQVHLAMPALCSLFLLGAETRAVVGRDKEFLSALKALCSKKKVLCYEMWNPVGLEVSHQKC